MNPAYVQTNVRGEVSTKAEEVGEVRDHVIHYDKFESTDLKVRVFGDAAVATGQTWIKATGKKSGRAIDASLRFTDTFVKQNGKWQAVSSQTTLLPSQTLMQPVHTRNAPHYVVGQGMRRMASGGW